MFYLVLLANVSPNSRWKRGNAVTAGNDRDVFCSASWDLLVLCIWQEGDCVEFNNEGVGQSGMFGSVLRGQRGTQLGHVSGHQSRLSQA